MFQSHISGRPWRRRSFRVWFCCCLFRFTLIRLTRVTLRTGLFRNRVAARRLWFLFRTLFIPEITNGRRRRFLNGNVSVGTSVRRRGELNVVITLIGLKLFDCDCLIDFRWRRTFPRLKVQFSLIFKFLTPPRPLILKTQIPFAGLIIFLRRRVKVFGLIKLVSGVILTFLLLIVKFQKALKIVRRRLFSIRFKMSFVLFKLIKFKFLASVRPVRVTVFPTLNRC